MENSLPPIPAKRYFTIGEVGDLCGVKPHVLRYWEQEFTQLRPLKRRGNRRYYQHHEVLMIRRIRDLLYDQGFTINGARNRMQELFDEAGVDLDGEPVDEVIPLLQSQPNALPHAGSFGSGPITPEPQLPKGWHHLQQELSEIREMLVGCAGENNSTDASQVEDLKHLHEFP